MHEHCKRGAGIDYPFKFRKIEGKGWVVREPVRSQRKQSQHCHTCIGKTHAYPICSRIPTKADLDDGVAYESATYDASTRCHLLFPTCAPPSNPGAQQTSPCWIFFSRAFNIGLTIVGGGDRRHNCIVEQCCNAGIREEKKFIAYELE